MILHRSGAEALSRIIDPEGPEGMRAGTRWMGLDFMGFIVKKKRSKVVVQSHANVLSLWADRFCLPSPKKAVQILQGQNL